MAASQIVYFMDLGDLGEVHLQIVGIVQKPYGSTYPLRR